MSNPYAPAFRAGLEELQLPNPRDELRRRARIALEGGIGQIMVAVRSGLEATKELRAQAEPVLALTEGAQAELKRYGFISSNIDDALARLEPFADVPELAPLKALLTAMKPLIAALQAVETARMALALLTIPDPIAVGAAGLVAVAREIESGIDAAVKTALAFVEG